MISFISTKSATITANSATIDVAEAIDFSIVTDSYLCAISDGQYLVPVVSGTAPTDGRSQLKLAQPWGGVTLQNTELFVFPTFENIAKTVESMNALNDISRGILSRFKALLESTDAEIDIKVGTTAKISAIPFGHLTNKLTDLINQTNSLAGSVTAMTKPEFDAIRRNEIRAHLGAGFKRTDFNNDYEFKQVDGWQNKFKINASEILIDGVWHAFPDTLIQLNDAPNGLQNIDLSQPDYSDLAAAIVAGGTSLSKSYLNQREIVIAVQEDKAVTAPNVTFIQDANNHVYSDNGVLRQRVLSFIIERIPASVPTASKHFAYGDARNAMSALGWTETDITGQWKKGAQLGVALMWIERRNQGAGHPMNPDGCSGIWASGSIVRPWYSNPAQFNNLSQCFDFSINAVSKVVSGKYSGKIGGSSQLWNGDGGFYDAIYASDINDFRLSISPRDSNLLESAIHQAVAGEIRGFESAPFTHFTSKTVTISGGVNYSESNGQTLTFATSDSSGPRNQSYQAFLGKKITHYLLSGSNGKAMIIPKIGNSGNDYCYWPHQSNVVYLYGSGDVREQFNQTFPPGTVITLGVQYNKKMAMSSSPMWTDIIGTPQQILATAQTLGVDGFFGSWIPTLPNGSTKTFNMTRKPTQSMNHVYTRNQGSSFTATSWALDGNGSSNARTYNPASTEIAFVFYQTNAHFTSKSSNRKIIDVGAVIAGGYHSIDGYLVSTLIDKVCVNNAGSGLGTMQPATQYSIDPRSKSFYTSAQKPVHHEPIDASTMGTGPAVKTLTSLAEFTGCYVIQFNFKEMKHTGNWGDDNKIQAVDGVAILPDENNKPVKYGTHIYVTNVPVEK